MAQWIPFTMLNTNNVNLIIKENTRKNYNIFVNRVKIVINRIE